MVKGGVSVGCNASKRGESAKQVLKCDLVEGFLKVVGDGGSSRLG